MSTPEAAAPGRASASSSMALVSFLFFLSGISGLIYQVVWLRMLIRALGTTVYATSLVVGAFMGGLALGSWWLGRRGDSVENKLRLYAFLELGVGLLAVALLAFFAKAPPIFRFLHDATAGIPGAYTLLQPVILFLLLLGPTSLMGATLPVLSAHTASCGAAFQKRLKALYGLNTLGATLGVLFSGFYAIGELGETRTVLIGAAINVIVALLALRLSSGRAASTPVLVEVPKEGAPESTEDPGLISPYPERTRRLVLLAYGLSGFVAISYEIIWTRLFQIHLCTSVYAFSAMLAYYLLGVGLGSLREFVPRRLARNPLAAFGILQMLLGLAALAGMYVFPNFKSSLGSEAISDYYFPIMAIPPLVVLPVTLLLGFLFPVTSLCYVRGERHASEDVGRLYSVNTMGGIVGSLVTGFVLVGLLGTRGTMLVLVATSVLLGWQALHLDGALRRMPRWTAGAAAFTLLIVGLGLAVPDPFFRTLERTIQGSGWRIFYHREGVSATTTAAGRDDDPLARQLLINGVGMTKLCAETKLMVHLPLLLHPQPKNILVACLGMGTAIRSAWSHSQLDCHVVELVAEEYDCLPFFHADAATMLADARFHRHVGDARNHLLMSSDRYDVITMDPAPPLWSSGTVNLYSREYFQLCRDHLTPDGIMCAWVQPAEFTDVWMILRTFQGVFPTAELWRGVEYPGLLLIGYNGAVHHPAPGSGEWPRFKAAEADARIMADLREWAPQQVVLPRDMTKLFVLDSQKLATLVEGAREITDDHPYTEFPLWRSLYDPMYHRMLDARVVEYWRQLTFEKGGNAR